MEPAQRAARLVAALARFRVSYGRLLEGLVGLLMVVLFVEVTLGVAFRGLGRALIWYDEVASVLLAWLTFYGAALASVRRAHIGCPELVQALPWRSRRALSIAAQVVVMGFFVLLGVVGASILPILATDSMVSIPWIPMSVVQSVIPISAALILIGEATHLIDLVVARTPPPSADGAALADGLH